MNDGTRDDRIQAWIRSGPVVASPELMARTLDPIPHMRQRRSWWIGLDDLRAAFAGPLGVAATVAVAVIVVVALLPRVPLGTAAPSPTTAVSIRPSFELQLGEGPGAIVVASDPAASVATCTGDPGGPWHVLYAGGDPFTSMDVLVGAGADTAAGAGRVAAEITADDRYVRFDPAVLRGGDPPGRSTATVTVSTDGPATTFVVRATTPDRTTGDDGDPVAVALTLTCAPAP